MPLKTKQMTEMVFIFLFPLLVWESKPSVTEQVLEKQDSPAEDVFLLCLVVLLFLKSSLNHEHALR